MNYLITATKSYHTSHSNGVAPIGLFYLANQLQRIGQPFKFSTLNEATDGKSTIYLSFLLSDHIAVINTPVKKIILGGIGANKNNIITTGKELLVFCGAASHLDEHTLLHASGLIVQPSLPADIEIPIIPDEYLDRMEIIPYNNGKGCSYGKCSFCTREKLTALDPEMAAEAIIAIYNKYKRQVQLSLDGPSKQYLNNICDYILTASVDVKWGCSAMVRNLDKEMLDKLSIAGCVSIGIGLEYLEDNVLDAISKGSTTGEYFEIIEIVNDLHMYAHFCIINFDPYVPTKYKRIHHNNLQKILNKNNIKFSFSVLQLRSNACTDEALEKVFRQRLWEKHVDAECDHYFGRD
ncbi:hypothetical protein LCGC14_1832580 [marine sediment metagenome]|uniref:Elp3/MiaA/NifB-like radical SAM core domain-containing protein n=1 Tax=marine sediment metagenome TaxID=412755 RepID=A0A0F9IV50_9ZZZZ